MVNQANPSRRNFLSGALAAAAVGAAFQSDVAAAEQPDYGIFLRSHDVGMWPARAVHNELELRLNGASLYVNGHAYHRVTGECLGYALDENHTLIANLGVRPYGHLSGTRPRSVVELWRGSAAEALDKQLRCVEAIASINEQDLDYVAVGLNTRAQNSNSVAYTITRALGLRFPRAIENMWAPGHGRDLMPENFRSYFDLYPITQANMHHFTLDGLPHHRAYMKAIGMLGASTRTSDEIARDVRNRGHSRDGQRLRFFDPRRPFFHTRLGQNFVAPSQQVSELMGRPTP